MSTHIQLLRNSNLYSDRATAVAGITEKARTLADGTPILGRYTSGNTTRTLLGLVHNDATLTAGTITILSDSSDVDEIKAKIEALDFADSAKANQYVSAVNQTDGKIAVTRATLPVHDLSDTSETDKFVTAVKLEDGIIKADRSGITSAQVTRTAGDLKGTTVEAALGELNSKITATSEADKVTVSTATTATEGYLKTYVISQGGKSVGKIDIPKDFLVKSGSVVKGTFAADGTGSFTEATDGTDTAIKLVINAKDSDATASNIYINAASLVDVYTAKNATDSSVAVSISNYKVSADLVSADKTHLKNALTGATVNGQAATVANNVAAVTVDASQVKFSTAYTGNTGGVTKSGVSIEDNVKALEKAVIDNEVVVAAAENHLNDTKLDTITITGGTINNTTGVTSARTASIVIDGGTVKVASLPTTTGIVAVGDSIDTALAKLSNSSSADGGKVGNIITAVGLGTDGKYVATTGATTSAAKSTKAAIEALDAAVVANDTKHTISSATLSVATAATGTTINVNVDNSSIKIGSDKKLYVDTIDGGTF